MPNTKCCTNAGELYRIVNEDDNVVFVIDDKVHTLQNDDAVCFAMDLVDATCRVGHGVRLIMAERWEQVDRGFDAEHDDLPHNQTGELVQAAAYLIDPSGNQYPAAWAPTWKHHFDQKSDPIERLKVAGALIAAELDRLMRIDDTKEQ